VEPDCENFLDTQSFEFIQEIKLKCLDFYLTVIQEMLKRLLYNDIIIKELIFL